MIGHFKLFKDIFRVNLSAYLHHATTCNSDIPKISLVIAETISGALFKNKRGWGAI
jgi:hypothetical protein